MTCTPQFDNLNEIGQFLEKYKLPQFTQNERDNLNNPITKKWIEFINFKFPQKEFLDSDGFTGEFH